MSAEYVTEMLRDADLKYMAKEIPAMFAEIVARCEYDYGHSGYTGTFAETPGVDVTRRSFEDWDVAFKWIDENTDKWENAKAVRVEGENPGWAIGAWCSS